MGRIFSYRAGHSNGHARQRHKSDLKGNRFQSKLFRQQVEVQKEQTVEHQHIGNSKINYTYNSSLTLTQQLIILFTIMGVLVPLATAHQGNSNPSSEAGKDNMDLEAARRFIKKLSHSTGDLGIVEEFVDILDDFVYFSSNFRSPEIQDKTVTNLKEHLYQKTRYDEKLYYRDENEQFQKCDYILNAIPETIIKLPSSKEHIERSIRDPRFELRCISKDRLDNGFKAKTTAGLGLLDIKSSLADEEDIWQTIHHEFRHMDFSLLHQNEACRTNLSELALPFFPTTPKMIDEFTKALDMGDQRIRKFSSLWERKQKGKLLTLSEKKQLNKYEEASKGCLGTPWMENITKSKYKELENLLAQSKLKENKPITFVTNSGIEVELLKLSIGNISKFPVYNAYVKGNNGIVNVLRLLTTIEQKLDSPSYDPSLLLLDEREAFTMEGLSLKAMQVFYKEAYQMTQKFINRCSSQKPLTNPLANGLDYMLDYIFNDEILQ